MYYTAVLYQAQWNTMTLTKTWIQKWNHFPSKSVYDANFLYSTHKNGGVYDEKILINHENKPYVLQNSK